MYQQSQSSWVLCLANLPIGGNISVWATISNQRNYQWPVILRVLPFLSFSITSKQMIHSFCGRMTIPCPPKLIPFPVPMRIVHLWIGANRPLVVKDASPRPWKFARHGSNFLRWRYISLTHSFHIVFKLCCLTRLINMLYIHVQITVNVCACTYRYRIPTGLRL